MLRRPLAAKEFNTSAKNGTAWARRMEVEPG